MAHFVFFVFSLSLLLPVTQGSTCDRHSCHGDVGNLGVGRDVYVSSTCDKATSTSQTYCTFEDGDCSARECSPCVDGVSGLTHSGSYLLDSPFAKKKTYWQSGIVDSDDEKVILRFDLETAFYFTHLIMVFKTPRPGAMVLERSVDYGKTWQVYKYYAKDCWETFGMLDDDEMADANCTTQYSSPEPCTKGEVIHRVLNPVDPIDDPYSADSRHLLKVTNLRVQMWQPQFCTGCLEPGEDLVPFRHFAVYDLIIRGTCFCNGHADSCIPLETAEFEPSDSRRAVVHGKCICEHNTAGDHCGECMPLYNDAPWRAGNGYTGEANACKRCNCNSHSDSCYFDERIWALTRQTSGGVCENCKHNTVGRTCDLCADHYFRRPDSAPTDPDVCQECNCHVNGTVSMVNDDDLADVDVTVTQVPLPCNPISGRCVCKDGVAGKRCDRCQKGYWGIGPQGCQRCTCSTSQCDQVSGECIPDYGDDEDTFFEPYVYHPSSDSRRITYSEYIPRYPSYPSIDQLSYPEHGKGELMAASWRRAGSCICKEKELDSVPAFCKMKYDYAIKVRVLGAEDDGTTTVISVAVKRIIKQSKVKIRKGKMFMYPESWTVMGCTCPALLPRSDYIVVGHEDQQSHRLMVNTDSFVKRWSYTKNWARIVNKVLRSKCG